MRALLNTLYITTQGAYLKKDGDTVLVSVEHETRLRVPIHTLSGIVCFGNIGCSPPLMGFCAERQVGLSFLSEHGRFLARVEGETKGNVLLRREQYRIADSDAASTEMARGFLIGKLGNARQILLRGGRERTAPAQSGDLDRAAAYLAGQLKQIQTKDELEGLRGIEGDAARTYFEVFPHLIVSDSPAFAFKQRSRRPPLDPVNALLSFVYTLLTHDVRGALETVGLDSFVGFLHRDRPGRAGLALDMMEELRPFVADRLVLSLINRKQIREEHFRYGETGDVYLNDDGRKAVLTAYQSKKQEEISHPFLGEKLAIGLVPFVQAVLLARTIRKDLSIYPPFLPR
jgi:CRISPR-associated protein Cas1